MPDESSEEINEAIFKLDKSAVGKVQEIWLETSKQKNQTLERQRQLEEERSKMMAYFDRREKDLSDQAEKMKEEYYRREKELDRHLNEKLHSLEIENKTKSRNLEAAAEAVRQRAHEVEAQEISLKKQLENFSKDKERYDEDNNKKLQSTSEVYVGKIIAELKTREDNLSTLSFWWSVSGGVSLLLAMIIAALSLYQTSSGLENGISLPALTFLTLKGAAFIIISGLAARYSFILSRRYLNESLRVSETSHNLSFGRLYVQSYGATAGWDQVKEAFSKWGHSQEIVVQGKPDEESEDKYSTVSLEVPKVIDLLKAIKDLKG
ncbi:hypothetical protein [Paracoccus sp. PAMC 22219]|uniref:hypothetical protein n=1 Tax=Paracoccus sp. PAMC 22219 TaxID=1569209 RepID=UPI0012DFF60D|nr:hypothetical protein [Paracoccus sp. PAMC 22219]